MKVIADLEANNLWPRVDTIWCICARDIDTGETFEWTPDTLHQFKDWAKGVEQWVGHNFLSYDARVIRKVLGVHIPANQITDTLIMSRLQMYTRQGGHSLENLGLLVHRPKGEFSDWSRFSPEMLAYCHNDVETCYHVYIYLQMEKKRYGSHEAERLEHGAQYILDRQKDHGFPINIAEAHRLQSEISARANRIQQEMETEMPPITRPDKSTLITPIMKKDGTYSRGNIKYLSDDWVNVAGPHTRLQWEEFDPASPRQCVRRLEGHWNPTIRTKGYRKLQQNRDLTQKEKEESGRLMWQLCEENLGTIKASAPKSMKEIGEYLMLRSRENEINGWMEGLGEDGRIHGNCQSVGAVTHRASHSAPNIGNTTGIESPYGKEFRRCFNYGGDPGYVMIGTDAAGIQLRILAHHMNDPAYTQEVVDGDIHTRNLEAMGIDKGGWVEDKGQWANRAKAKTFIYAWLLGAGDEKVGLICGGSPAMGRKVKEQFLAAIPALARLKEEAAQSARVGRFVGLDGRKIEVKGEHYALSVYLQGDESIVMKKAMVLYHQRAFREGLDFQQLAFVHDEFQCRVREDHAEKLGEIQVGAIRDAGLYYKLRCPLDGGFRVGKNWLDTH